MLSRSQQHSLVLTLKYLLRPGLQLMHQRAVCLQYCALSGSERCVQSDFLTRNICRHVSPPIQHQLQEGPPMSSIFMGEDTG